jgi:hypothetical protein
MLHLSPERLAALADDEPTAAEAQHLVACGSCGGERSAHRSLLVLAGHEHDWASEPLTEWTTLSERLRDEGLLKDEGLLRPERPVLAARRLSRGWMRSAAAVLIVAAGGVAAGRISAGAPVLPPSLASDQPTETVGRGNADGASLVADGSPEYASTTEALASFLAAQREMQNAASFLAERQQDAAPELTSRTYQARLAATEGMVAVSRAALYDAPTDPYINQYYLASLGARDAAIRQIRRGVPPGAELVPF